MGGWPSWESVPAFSSSWARKSLPDFVGVAFYFDCHYINVSGRDDVLVFFASNPQAKFPSYFFPVTAWQTVFTFIFVMVTVWQNRLNTPWSKKLLHIHTWISKNPRISTWISRIFGCQSSITHTSVDIHLDIQAGISMQGHCAMDIRRQ